MNLQVTSTKIRRTQESFFATSNPREFDQKLARRQLALSAFLSWKEQMKQEEVKESL